MRKKKRLTRSIYSMLEAGCTTKEIITKLHCKPQAVYNARYEINKKLGLGAISGTGIVAANPILTPAPLAPPPLPLSFWQRLKNWVFP